MNKEWAEHLIQEILTERVDLFPVDVAISSRHNIRVHIDEDQDLSLKKCVRVSRHLQGCLSYKRIDCALEASSPGLRKSLNGRQLSAVTSEGTYYLGMLKKADQDTIFLQWPEFPLKRKKKEYYNLRKSLMKKLKRQK